MNILLVLEIDSNRLKEASVTEAMYEYHLLQKISVHKSGKIRQINAPKGLLLSKQCYLSKDCCFMVSGIFYGPLADRNVTNYWFTESAVPRY